MKFECGDLVVYAAEIHEARNLMIVKCSTDLTIKAEYIESSTRRAKRFDNQYIIEGDQSSFLGLKQDFGLLWSYNEKHGVLEITEDSLVPKKERAKLKRWLFLRENDFKKIDKVSVFKDFFVKKDPEKEVEVEAEKKQEAKEELKKEKGTLTKKKRVLSAKKEKVDLSEPVLVCVHKSKTVKRVKGVVRSRVLNGNFFLEFYPSTEKDVPRRMRVDSFSLVKGYAHAIGFDSSFGREPSYAQWKIEV